MLSIRIDRVLLLLRNEAKLVTGPQSIWLGVAGRMNESIWLDCYLLAVDA